MKGKKFETSAQKAKRTLLGITIPRDELAVRIGEACCGIKVDLTTITPAQALAKFDELSAADPRAAPMGTQFRAAADAAVLFLRDRINAASQPH